MEPNYLADNSNKIFNSFMIMSALHLATKNILICLSWIPVVTALVLIVVNCCMYSCMYVCNCSTFINCSFLFRCDQRPQVLVFKGQ